MMIFNLVFIREALFGFDVGLNNRGNCLSA
jgi:hypothetical protein